MPVRTRSRAAQRWGAIVAILLLWTVGSPAAAPRTHPLALTLPAPTRSAALPTRWSIAPQSGPQPASGVALAWDPADGVLFRFGGRTALGDSGELWAYRPTATGRTAAGWALIAPKGSVPTPRSGASLVWDSVDRVLLLFDGRSAQQELDSLWSYKPGRAGTGSGQWTDLTANGSPLRRADHVAAWDSSDGVMIVIGGAFNGTPLGDTWSYHPARGAQAAGSWTRLPAVPAPRQRAMAVWDATARRLLVFGGEGYGGLLADLWALQIDRGGRSGGWRRLAMRTPLGPRAAGAAAWDSTHERVLIFGGQVPMPAALPITTTVAPLRTATVMPSVSATPSASATATATSSTTDVPPSSTGGVVTPTASTTATASSTGTATVSATLTASPTTTTTATPTAGTTATASSTPTASMTTTSSPSATLTASPTGTATASATLTASPTGTATASATSSPVATLTGTAVAIETATAAPSITATATASTTATATLSGTVTTASSVRQAAGASAAQARPRVRADAEDYTDDLWAYTPSRMGAGRWQSLGLGGPAPRSAQAVYDAHDALLLVQGGQGIAPFGDLWSYATKGRGAGRWLQREGGFPVARAGQAGSWDPRDGVLFLYGGYSGSGWLGDLWAYRPQHTGAGRWTLLRPRGVLPPARTEASLVWDSTHNVLLLYGGANARGALDDVWVYRPAGRGTGAGAWQSLSTNPLPLARHLHSAVWDTRGRQMLIYGGATTINTALSDLWSLTLDDLVHGRATWHYLAVPTALAGRYAHAAIWDATHVQMLVFGGVSAAGRFLDDLWSYTPSAPGAGRWRPLGNAGRPDGRSGVALAWDGAADAMYLFGGLNLSGQHNDLYAYRPGSGWVLRRPDTTLTPAAVGHVPSPRDSATLVYNTSDGTLLLFGGSDLSGNRNDLWIVR